MQRIGRPTLTSSVLHASRHSFSQLSGYSGPNSTQLQTMTDVESNHLEEDHTFVTKVILDLCIAEEANLRYIKMKVERSDDTNLIVVGILEHSL